VTADRRLRGAIVGAGLMGRWHADAIARSGHIVAAVVDPDGARADALASRYPQARGASRLAAVEAVDVVHVCTPLATHVAVAREALGRGCHVISEKPLAPSATETRDLIDLAQASGRMIVPVHQFLFQRGVERALRALPAIAPLLHVDFAICTAGASHLEAPERDRLVLEILPHPLSLVARLVSPAIAGTPWQVRRSGPGELRADTILDSTTVSILISAGCRPTTNTMRLLGARGTLHLDLFHGFAFATRGRTTRTGKALQPFVTGATMLVAATANLARRAVAREAAYPGLRDLVGRVYTSARSGGAPPITTDEALAVAIATDLIRDGVPDSRT
jgi:predicted dehydrogenase